MTEYEKHSKRKREVDGKDLESKLIMIIFKLIFSRLSILINDFISEIPQKKTKPEHEVAHKDHRHKTENLTAECWIEAARRRGRALQKQYVL